MELKIEYLPIKALKPYEKNTRKHQKKDVDNIARSIEKYGMCDAIGIWSDDNIIVEGHGRMLACKQLGMTEVPCVRLDHLTDEQRREYAIAHNATAELSEWDLDILPDELADLNLDDFDFDFGIEDEEEETEIVEDEAPEVDEDAEPIAKLGDIWRLGRHRLMCGDSTDKVTVELLMDGKKADMVFTDPPYGYEYQSNFREKTEKFDVIENDDKILNFMPCTKEFCKGFVFVCTMWKTLHEWLPLFKEYFELTNLLIWHKPGGGLGDLERTFGTDHEIILVSHNGARITGKRLGSVWKVARDNVNAYNHPTQKPVQLSAIAIENTTEAGAIVLDLFGGSGSTLIACEQLDRTCYMMELDPKYCDVILQRYINLNGTSEDVYRLNSDGTKTKYADLT
jgi:DNA modification methylase